MSDSLTPWTVVHQAPLSIEFPRQGYWSGLSFPSPGDLPDSRMEPGSPALQERAGQSQKTMDVTGATPAATDSS